MSEATLILKNTILKPKFLMVVLEMLVLMLQVLSYFRKDTQLLHHSQWD